MSRAPMRRRRSRTAAKPCHTTAIQFYGFPLRRLSLSLIGARRVLRGACVDDHRPLRRTAARNQDGWEKGASQPGSDQEACSSLMECSQCWEIMHPACLAERNPHLVGLQGNVC
ncbi:hypothetical protein MRX96_040808 [Rhipicephalus microplus]